MYSAIYVVYIKWSAVKNGKETKTTLQTNKQKY